MLREGTEPPPGWVLVKTTVLRRMAIAHLEAGLPPPPGHLRIGPVSRGGRDWPRWIALHDRRYRATHRDNPPRALLVRERARVFAGSDLMLALGLWRNNRLVRFASLREGGDAGAEVGWIGAEGPHPARSCGWLLGHCTREGRRRGLRWLDIEIDDTDDQLAALRRRLPPGREHAFRTWEAPVRG